MTALAPPLTTISATSRMSNGNDWQTTFRKRLEERQAADSVHAQLIEQCRWSRGGPLEASASTDTSMI
jgi:hypothetical protein